MLVSAGKTLCYCAGHDDLPAQVFLAHSHRGGEVGGIMRTMLIVHHWSRQRP